MGVFGVFGSKATEHSWFLDERSSRGFLLSLESRGERSFLKEPRTALYFSLIGVDPMELTDFMVAIFTFASASSGKANQFSQV